MSDDPGFSLCQEWVVQLLVENCKLRVGLSRAWAAADSLALEAARLRHELADARFRALRAAQSAGRQLVGESATYGERP